MPPRVGDDSIDIVGLANVTPEEPVHLAIHHADGDDLILTTHTMSSTHLAWFKAGSALDALRRAGSAS